jgi:hypothetical protein
MTLMNWNWTVRLIRKLKKITRSKTRWLSQVWLIPSSSPWKFKNPRNPEKKHKTTVICPKISVQICLSKNHPSVHRLSRQSSWGLRHGAQGCHCLIWAWHSPASPGLGVQDWAGKSMAITCYNHCSKCHKLGYGAPISMIVSFMGFLHNLLNCTQKRAAAPIKSDK